MLTILLAYTVLFFWFGSFGLVLNKQFFSHTLSIFDSILLGVLGYSLITLAFSFVMPLGGWYGRTFIFLSLLVTVLFQGKYLIKHCCQKVVLLEKTTLLFFTFGTILITWYSCTSPFFIDHDSYYLPTLKWFSEFGIIPGVGNLHHRLAYLSGWHALESTFQSIFGFSNLFFLNGFLLCLFFYKAILDKGILLLTMLALPLLILFVNMPAPDLPVILIAIYLLLQYLRKNVNLSYALVLSSILITIKPSLVLLPIFFLILIIKNFSRSKEGVIFSLLVSAITGLFFFLKNIIATAYLLFPAPWISFNVDWKIPIEILDLHNYYVRLELWGVNELTTIYSIEAVQNLVLKGGIDSIFYFLVLITLFSFPILGRIKKFQSPYFYSYFLYLISTILLYILGPAPRFYIPFILLFGSIILIETLPKKILNSSKISVLVIIFGFLPITIQLSGISISANAHMNTKETINYLPVMFFRNYNETRPYTYNKDSISGMNYYYPVGENIFPLALGNAPLPSISPYEIERNASFFNLIPALRTDYLKDGFYMKTIQESTNEKK